MSAKTLRYHKKVVSFGEEELVLWSLDGNTWSTRKEELVNIHERHENEKVTFEQIRSGNTSKRKAKENTESVQQPEAKATPPVPKKSEKIAEKPAAPTKQKRATRGKAKVTTKKTTAKKSSSSAKAKAAPKKKASTKAKKTKAA